MAARRPPRQGGAASERAGDLPDKVVDIGSLPFSRPCPRSGGAPEWWAMDDLASERLRAALENIAEELADMGRARLSEAIRTDSTAAVAAERRLSRARRAVLKAAALLRDGAEGDDLGDGPSD